MPSYEKCDAALIAALQSHFAGYEFSARLVSLLIELKAEKIAQTILDFESLCKQHSAQWVQAHTQASSRFLTATGSLQWLEQLQAQPWVFRLALANQLRPARPEPQRSQTARTGSDVATQTQGSVLLGVIDHGCPFANEQLLREDGGTRVLSIWDQDPVSEFKPALSFVPTPFGYGAQVNRQQLNVLMRKSIATDELQAYQALGYESLRHQLTHGAHTLNLFAGAKLSRSVLEKSFAITPELNRRTAVKAKPSQDSDIVFVQLPRRALLSPSTPGMSRSILDGVRFILSQTNQETQRVVICIPYGSLLGPHDGSSLIEQALDAIVVRARRQGLDVKLVFSSGNAADKAVYARTKPALRTGSASASMDSQLIWMVPPHLQANTSLDIWLKQPDQQVQLKVTEPGGFVHAVTLSSGMANEAHALQHQGRQVGVMAIVNDASHGQLNLLLQLLPNNAGSGAHILSGRWCVEWPTGSAAPLDACFYVGWGGRNNGFGQRIFATRLMAGSSDIEIPPQGTILGTACGHETYVVGACTNAPAYQRVAHSGSGKPRGGSKARASCLSVSEESDALPGLACSGVRSSFNARVNGTSVAAPLAARMLADEGWLLAAVNPARKGSDRPTARPSQAAGESPIDIRQL
jgi:hypothetical protein